MPKITYFNRTEEFIDCLIDDVPLRIVEFNWEAYRTDENVLVILKDHKALERQVEFLSKLNPKSILEFRAGPTF